MKKLLLILVVILLPIHLIGQQSKEKHPTPLVKFGDNVKLPLTTKEKAQIIEVYGEYANEYVFENPHRLRSLKHLLRNRIVYKTMSDNEDKKPYVNLSEVPLNNAFVEGLKRDVTFNAKNFNPLKYNFNLFTKRGGMYRIDGTNQYIIIKSQYQ